MEPAALDSTENDGVLLVVCILHCLATKVACMTIACDIACAWIGAYSCASGAAMAVQWHTRQYVCLGDADLMHTTKSPLQLLVLPLP